MTNCTKTLPLNGGLTNPKWKYRDSVSTDLRATFRKARAALQSPQKEVRK